ncbi:MAG: stage III sporulation protein AE [Lachnospiraceae bacterium]
MELESLEMLTDEIFPALSLDGTLLVEAVMNGDIDAMVSMILEATIQALRSPLVNTKELLVSMLLIGIAATLCKQFSLLVLDEGAQKLSFWIIYILLIKQLLELYYVGQAVVVESLESMVLFGNVFVPVFTVVLTAAAGSVTSAGYVATLVLVVYIVQNMLLLLLIPCVEGYALLVLLGSLGIRDRMEKLLEFFEKGFSLVFKVIFFAVFSIGGLQSMLLPFLGSAQTGVAKKVISMVPAVGDVAEGTFEIVTGAAILVKNGIGVIGIIVLFLLVLSPVVKLGILCVTIKIVAVVFDMLGEKQMMWCTDKMAYAHVFLLKVTAMSVSLLLLWIMLAVYTTNQRLLF